MVSEHNLNIYSGENSPQGYDNLDYQQQMNFVNVPLQKQDSNKTMFLNVDSTILKLEDSGVSTESVQQVEAPIELAMQLQRMNETENETAAFNISVMNQLDQQFAID